MLVNIIFVQGYIVLTITEAAVAFLEFLAFQLYFITVCLKTCLCIKYDYGVDIADSYFLSLPVLLVTI